MPHRQGKATQDYQVTRFCNCSPVTVISTFYLTPILILEVLEFPPNSETSTAVWACLNTPPRAQGQLVWELQAPKQERESRLICESLGPSAGCLL